MSNWNLWLDDVRDPVHSEGWSVCRTVDEAITLIRERGTPLHMSLDHDLGDGHKDATFLVDWLAEQSLWPAEGIYVHSQNPVGADNMLRTIDRYAAYTRKVGRARLR